MSMGLSTGSDIMNAGIRDPELAHHEKKIHRYEDLATWAKSLGPIARPLVRFYEWRLNAHERAYVDIASYY